MFASNSPFERHMQECVELSAVRRCSDSQSELFVFFFLPSSLVLSFRQVLFAPGDKQAQPVHSLTALQINFQPKIRNCEHVADMWPDSRHLLLLLPLWHSGGSASARPGCWTYGSHNIPTGPLTGTPAHPQLCFCRRPRRYIRPIVEVCGVAAEAVLVPPTTTLTGTLASQPW